MESMVIRVLVLEPHAGLRKAITSVKRIPRFDDVAIESIEAETPCQALVALETLRPDVLIIEPALGPDDCSGLHVIACADARKIPVLVHTSQRLADPIQAELAFLRIPVLVKAVDSVVLMQLAVLRALKADKPIDDIFDAFVRVAYYLRALPGSLADNIKTVVALAVDAAIKDHQGNKTAAAESLGVSRHYLNRILAWLPRPEHLRQREAHRQPLASETRLRVDALAKVRPPTNVRKANDG
jgi:DNA-binding NtrC family response regulator